MRLATISIVSALACMAGAAPAQTPQWQTYKISNTGVPGGEVTMAVVDPEGDVWVSATDPWAINGTEGGVAEFDGVAWTNYSNTNSPLPTPHVSSVAFDADGSEWIATNGGLMHKQGNVWTRYTSSNSGLANNSMGELAFDSTGALWMLHYNGAVSRFDGTTWNTWSITDLGWVSTIVPSTLVVDTNDDVWVGTEYAGGLSKLDWGTQGPGATWQVYGNGAPKLFMGDDGHVWAIDLDINLDWAIYRYNGMERQQMPDFGPGNFPYSTLRILSDGTYFVGTYTGMVGHYDGSSFRYHQFNSSHVYTIDVDDEGNAWVAGKGHCKKLDPVTGAWTYYNLTTTGLADRGIQEVEFDTEGRAWMSTTTGGLSQFDGTTWRGHSPYNGGTPFWPISGNGLSDGLVAHPNGDMWAGASIEGVLQWDGTQWIRHLGSGYWVDAVGIAADGSVWVGPVPGGLNRYDGTTWTTIPTPLLSETRVIKGHPNGDVFVGGRGGLLRWDGTSWTTYNTANSGLPDVNVTDIDFAPNGDWWIATYGGLGHFDGTTWTTYTEANSGLVANVVSCVKVAPNGDVWCGAFQGLFWPYYGGVSQFTGSVWETYDISNSPMEDEQIFSLDIDAEGNVWIGQAQGAVLVALVGNAPPFTDPWTDLGQGLAGTNGTPVLTGQGSLTSWSTFGFRLDNARENGTAILALGATAVNLPFVGGTLVPQPALAISFPINDGGRGSLVSTWPPGMPAGLPLYAQCWQPDPAAIRGAAASNAVLAITP